MLIDYIAKTKLRIYSILITNMLLILGFSILSFSFEKTENALLTLSVALTLLVFGSNKIFKTTISYKTIFSLIVVTSLLVGVYFFVSFTKIEPLLQVIISLLVLFSGNLYLFEGKRKKYNVVLLVISTILFIGLFFLKIIVVDYHQEKFKKDMSAHIESLVSQFGISKDSPLCTATQYICIQSGADEIASAQQPVRSRYVDYSAKYQAIIGLDKNLQYVRVTQGKQGLVLSYRDDYDHFNRNRNEFMVIYMIMLTVWLILSISLLIVHHPKSLKKLRNKNQQMTIKESK